LASGHRCEGDAVAEALAMIFSHPAAGAAIVGTINMAHMRENVVKLPDQKGLQYERPSRKQENPVD
jgi:hypothetical protein